MQVKLDFSCKKVVYACFQSYLFPLNHWTNLKRCLCSGEVLGL